MTAAAGSQHWDASRVPDQSGRVVVVTGATSGIGKEAARVLAAKGATVVLAVRDVAKGGRAADEFRREPTSGPVEVLALDLASLASVRAFVAAFTEAHTSLDVLIDNAGVMFTPYAKTADGFELQMGTNHLGHFALTGLLLPRLQATPGARVVVVSSQAHRLGDIDLDDLHWEKRRYNTQRAYGDSKLANLYFTYELARRLKAQGDHPRVTAAHPGWTATELQRHSHLMRLLNHVFAQSAEIGALPTLRAGFDEDARPGQFFGPDGRFQWTGFPIVRRSNDRSYDEAAARRLWELSEMLTGVSFP